MTKTRRATSTAPGLTRRTLPWNGCPLRHPGRNHQVATERAVLPVRHSGHTELPRAVLRRGRGRCSGHGSNVSTTQHRKIAFSFHPRHLTRAQACVRIYCALVATTHARDIACAQVCAGRRWGAVRPNRHVDFHAPASTERNPRGQGPEHRCGQRHRRVCSEVQQPDHVFLRGGPSTLYALECGRA